MLDEPSLGLAPIIVAEMFETIRRINTEGTTILLVEQNVRQALELATRGYVVETGRVVTSGTREELLASDEIRKAYLGL
jgi:branched-chain amino acid transport system ATP-binding protein